jgi:hypothetical protein
VNVISLDAKKTEDSDDEPDEEPEEKPKKKKTPSKKKAPKKENGTYEYNLFHFMPGIHVLVSHFIQFY